MPLNFVLAIAALNTFAEPARVCSLIGYNYSAGWTVETIEANVDSATQIVRVRAISADSATRMVTFEVMEWLRRMPTSGAALTLPGVVVARDDFNQGPVPYRTVRPAGQRGSCYAEQYRLGGEYVLLMREGIARYPIFWWPLGPVNEQITGDNDPWLKWVRERVARR